MKLSELVNKKILILGLGKEGLSTKAFLERYVPSSLVGTADQSEGPEYLSKQKEYDLVIRSPGVPKRMIIKPHTTATNIFFANTKGYIIGVTGSKGKSTTSSLIYDILHDAHKQVSLVGNIGKPVLDVFVPGDDTENFYVYELSSYQLDDIAYSPQVSVITNLFPEHMDYHGSVQAYMDAKKQIVAHATSNDYLVYNPTNAQLISLARETKVHAVPFVNTIPVDDNDIPLIGSHNRENIRAAVTVAQLLHIDDIVVSRAIKQFRPLPHRLEHIGIFGGIHFYDDAISTTPESTIAAIEALKNVKTIFLGGLDRGYDFSNLVDTLAGSSVDTIILFPDSGKRIVELLKKSFQKRYTIVETSSMEEAVQFAYAHTPKNGICLLSTASPSYSLWKNFEEKGDLFKRFVKEIGKEI